MSSVNNDDLYDLFQLISDDKDIEQISATVANNTSDYILLEDGRLLLLELTNGLILSVRFKVDHFILILSDESNYVLDDGPYTKMSSDRIMWYLRYLILNFKFPEDD